MLSTRAQAVGFRVDPEPHQVPSSKTELGAAARVKKTFHKTHDVKLPALGRGASLFFLLRPEKFFHRSHSVHQSLGPFDGAAKHLSSNHLDR
jgi:hypothetical protein